MIWSKLKKQIESRFADCFKGRLSIYSTRYTAGSYFMTRAWITLDGNELLNFSTPENYSRYLNEYASIEARVADSDRTPGKPAERGEFDKYEFTAACRDYLNMTVEMALSDVNPILNMLAVLDGRLGKRRLREIDPDKLHNLPKQFLLIRLREENLLPPGA